YAAPEKWNGPTLLLATYAFAFQIYCDFSGYSDIARGAALAMGINLMKNFDIPYHARSISEFWRRWHISLSTWFRDYVYIPLGGSRGSKLVTYRNLPVQLSHIQVIGIIVGLVVMETVHLLRTSQATRF